MFCVPGSDCKTFTAAAHGFYVGVVEAKGFADSFPAIVDFNAIQKLHVGLPYVNADAMLSKYGVVGFGVVDIVHYVGESGAAGFFDAQSQAEPAASFLNLSIDLTCCFFRDGDVHLGLRLVGLVTCLF